MGQLSTYKATTSPFVPVPVIVPSVSITGLGSIVAVLPFCEPTVAPVDKALVLSHELVSSAVAVITLPAAIAVTVVDQAPPMTVVVATETASS